MLEQPHTILPHILVVDDDERLRDLLFQYLSDRGFFITTAKDAKEARLKMQFFTFDAMVLDWMMPGESGIELAESLNTEIRPPVLMLTAMGEVENRIRGLEAGASDYLVKPFEPKELVLRLQNMLQRPSTRPAKKQVVYFGEFHFDLGSSRLFRQAEQIYLTTGEAHCLKALASNAGIPISREQLAEFTLGAQEKSNERSVDVQINRLRKKIEPKPGRPIYIQTVRGAGYVLHVD